MPDWYLPERAFDIPRNIALLDSNVLIEFIDERSANHEWTAAVISAGDYVWAVSYPAIIEAWNFLVGRHRSPSLAYQLMEWIYTPGNVRLLDDTCELLGNAEPTTRRLDIDIVDASLMHTADLITEACGFEIAVHIATWDSRDFWKCFGKLRYNLLDMRDASSTA